LGGHSFGRRVGHHPHPREFVVKVPRPWLRARKPIHFWVETGRGPIDRAPNQGRYIGL
jgi:hypothetical protein